MYRVRGVAGIDDELAVAYDPFPVVLTVRGHDQDQVGAVQYTCDLVGNRVAVTETVRVPDVVQTIEAYVEQNGLLVVEVENGTATASAGPIRVEAQPSVSNRMLSSKGENNEPGGLERRRQIVH